MRQKINIVGGGACALILAAELDPLKYEVAVYEKNAALGRKFLVAGEGGLNLTHSEPAVEFVQKYRPSAFIENAFSRFSNKEFIDWINQLGIETYVGSSGRIFPTKGIKPIQVLHVLLEKLKANGVLLYTKSEWKGFASPDELIFQQAGELKRIKSNLAVFCLGGASWPVTGSAGTWAGFFEQRGIQVLPFQASNCSFKIQWPTGLIPVIEGKALKNCAIRCENEMYLGEVVLTSEGIEGSGVYLFSPQIRDQIVRTGQAEIFMDMKPSLSSEALRKKLTAVGKGSYTEKVVRQLNLSRIQIALLKQFVSKSDFLDSDRLIGHLKNFRFIITGMGKIEDAISTVGGIALGEVSEHFEFKKLPGYFAIGEMLNFDAPTGGYLLQACFSMSKKLAEYLNTRTSANAKNC